MSLYQAEQTTTIEQLDELTVGRSAGRSLARMDE